VRPDIEEFLEREERRLNPSTFGNRKVGLTRYDEYLDDSGLEPADAGPMDFEDFVRWLINERGIFDRTAYEYLTQVWRFYQYLEHRGDDVQVPDKKAVVQAEGLVLTETLTEKHVPRSERSLSLEEMDMMIEHAPSFKSGLIMKILGSTGIRPKDLRDLQVRDIEDYRWIHVRSSKTRTRRKVPIPDGLRQYLRLWLEHGFRDACASAERSDYLIPGTTTEQLGESTVQKVVHKAAKSAGIQEVLFRDANGHKKRRITPYSFRYGYANHMKKKVDPETLQTLMGHKSVTTTMRFYTAASEEELAETATIAPDPG